jgi:hypothetical protein
MKSNSRSKTLVVILLSASLVATGCSAQWIKVALADLPVLLQMALNMGSLVTTLQSGQQLSAADAAVIQNISNQAGRDLTLLQTLYNQYKANPGASTIQKIQSAVADINQNLSSLLQAAHVSDPVLLTRVTAGVNLILTTVNSFAALIPQPAATAAAANVARNQTAVPQASDLKKQWNQQVCGPSGKLALDSALPFCQVK